MSPTYTKLNTYTYQVSGQHTVLPADVAVVDPVPGHPGQRPTQRLHVPVDGSSING